MTSINFKKSIFLLLSIVVISNSFAQLNSITIGDAINQGNNCFTITQDLFFQTGGVWYNNPIDFSEDFTIYYQANFGSKDFGGADGMALVIKGNPSAELGNSGGGLAYAGITPSVIVEFDTYQNGDFADPSFDHIAIMSNGVANHNNVANNLAGPVQASVSNTNIEDGLSHEVKIEWIASSQLFTVYFDCIARAQINLDIKNLIFFGDDSVFFGFVGSTGGESNLHEVCLNRVSFVDNLQLQDQVICDGQPEVIDASIPSGVSYSWSPIEGIDNPNIPNPTFSPTETTTYTVTITDSCGDIVTEDVTLSLLSTETPIFDEVDPICEGENLEELPLMSNNGISGFWTPTLNNTTSTTYTFIPTSNPCADSVTLDVVVNPIRIPTFDPVEPICIGDTIADLPTTSNNGISGTWTPNINNMNTSVYTFTPDPDEGCVDSITLEITVNTLDIPLFDFSTSICEGELFNLPTTSINGISGTWSPEFNNSTTNNYTFTPLAEECATPTTLEITVNPIITPIFDSVNPICEGETLEDLPTISNNGIIGSWSPELNNSATTLYTFTPDTSECANEITLEIVVNPLLIPQFDSLGPICPGQTLSALPNTSNNGITGSWSPELNNNTTTIYTFTPASGQGCITETTLEIIVTDPILPIFDSVNPICLGENLENLPTTSLNGITGFWSPALNNIQTTNYVFTPDNGQCAIETNLNIEVIPISELAVDIAIISEPFSESQTISVLVEGGTGAYEYQLDNGLWIENPIFTNFSGCAEHLIKVREISGCSNIASKTFRILDYPKFFTPNNDSFNDRWNIKCLSNQPNAKIIIFDRFGKILANLNPSNPGWDGFYNNMPMPSNDYWFKVDYFDTDGNFKTFTSNFTLKR
jgi:gliding motility-associated-like protein